MKITTIGTGATSGATSAQIAVPNDSTGAAARKVLVTVEGLTYIIPGSATTAVATTSCIVVGPDSPLVLDTIGITHIAQIELTAAKRVTVTPIDA